MWHAIITAMALLATAQAPAEVKAEKAAAAAGWLAPTRLSARFPRPDPRRDRRRASTPGADDAGRRPVPGPASPAAGRQPEPPTPRYTARRAGARHLLGGGPPRRPGDADLARLGQHARRQAGHPPRAGLARSRVRGQRRGVPRRADRDALLQPLPVRPLLLQPARPRATPGRRVEPPAVPERPT